jgi:hypothetical protein
MRRRTKWLLGLAAVLVVTGMVGSSLWNLEHSPAWRYERIQPGMTYQEVVDILGLPTMIIGRTKTQISYWMESDVTVWVQFDRVEDKVLENLVLNAAEDKVLEKGMEIKSSGWLSRLRELWERASSFLAGG